MNELLVEVFRLEALRRWPDPEPDGCWMWSRVLQGNKYPMFIRHHGKAPVHRLVVEAFHGGFPPGKPNALHRCDNKRCWRPSHIYAGSQAENMSDAHFRIMKPNRARYRKAEKS